VAWNPETLEAAPYRYFELCDAKDLDGIMAQYAPGARETVMPGGDTFSGLSEIREMYVNLFADFTTIRHEIARVVVDADRGRVGTEQSFVGTHRDGTVEKMYNCNFFDFDEQGRATRVYIWMSGASPLRG
jgi:predicted ester cyclase